MGGERVLERARSSYARIEGQVAPYYGLSSSLAIALPLLVGALTGNGDAGSVFSLGAFLVALRAPEGPYGARARNLASAILVVGIGSLIGGLLSGHPWLTAMIVPPIIVLGAAASRIGPTAGLAVLLTAVRQGDGDILYEGFLELMGGLLTTALFLAPWPARRLRPLRTTIAEAADAVAEAMDAVAEDTGTADAAPLEAAEPDDKELASVTRKHDWDEARLAAYQALSSARDTAAFYRSGRGRGDEPTRPERLLDALTRVLQETVEVRSQIEMAQSAPPEREWQQEARVAMSALAARVRLISGVVEATGDAPLGGGDSAAIRRLGRRSEAIHRAGLAGEEDLVAVAMIVDIRRSLERLEGSVDAARRFAAGGVQLGVGTPRLLRETPAPLHIWQRLRHAIRTRSPGFREVTRVGLVAVVAMTLSAALKLPHGHWLTITAMLSLRGTYGETVEHLVQRIGGTAVGSAFAAVLLTLVSDQPTTAILIFVVAMIAFSTRTVNFTYWWLFSTPLTMLLLDFSIPSGWLAAGQRVGLTLAGGVLAFLAVRLLWPTGYAERLPARLGRVIGLNAELSRMTAEVLERRADRLPQATLSKVNEAVDAVEEARVQLGKERVPDEEAIARLSNAVAAAHRVRDDLIAISRMPHVEEVDPRPLASILERFADAMEEAADALEDPDFQPPEPPPDAPSPEQRLTEEFVRLETRLASLARRRRAEVKSGVSTDEPTPLRRALLQASSYRNAARSLRGDIEELLENSRGALHTG
ncbi:hypothetical protein Acsp03_59700 [Actinomadura sp. NBRC 104412]|uniref:FUSC family protein n=1 Tax=Actinomadura sp. NBRC 104412 TaxID=3032203 RepID=UPI0024A1D825|nr:FUSC family protein [Actinomadura sp. NBRC 104412]GLZ08504.1 hypothetical protein Acsp03_59700 [Actinomadura sp. NBRC 104412]